MFIDFLDGGANYELADHAVSEFSIVNSNDFSGFNYTHFGFGVHYDSDDDRIGDLDDILHDLTREWVDECKYSSSLERLVEHPSYQRIIDIGDAALPYIFADLRSNPKPWFFALRKITGESIIPNSSAGNFREMLDAWLRWGERHGY